MAIPVSGTYQLTIRGATDAKWGASVVYIGS